MKKIFGDILKTRLKVIMTNRSTGEEFDYEKHKIEKQANDTIEILDKMISKEDIIFVNTLNTPTHMKLFYPEIEKLLEQFYKIKLRLDSMNNELIKKQELEIIERKKKEIEEERKKKEKDKEKIKNLEEAKKEFEEKNKKLEREKKELKEKNRRLEEEKKELEEINRRLGIQKNELERIKIRLEIQKNELEERNRRLEIQNENGRKKFLKILIFFILLLIIILYFLESERNWILKDFVKSIDKLESSIKNILRNFLNKNDNINKNTNNLENEILDLQKEINRIEVEIKNDVRCITATSVFAPFTLGISGIGISHCIDQKKKHEKELEIEMAKLANLEKQKRELKNN